MNEESTERSRRNVLRSLGAGGIALAGLTGAAVPAAADGTDGHGSDDGADGDGADGGKSDEYPVFHCSYVELSETPDVYEAVLVTFTDGSFVQTADGNPGTLGSDGRVVSHARIEGETFENPDRDCCPGEKSVTFTCESVTVDREEFVRDFGDEPTSPVDVVLYFEDGTEERRTRADPTDTFRGTGENEGKALAAFRMDHQAYYTSHIWDNPHVEGTRDFDGDGLSDEEEAKLGTHPAYTDTDGDGWSDLSEVNRDSDPLDPDCKP